VAAELLRLEGPAAATQLARAGGKRRLLYDLLADSREAAGTVNARTRMAADLGFDSLLIAELTVGLEKAG